MGVIKKYREYLPVTKKTPVISLNEGNTPLIRAEYIEKLIGGNIEIYLKHEGLNPTASFKDRGMTLAVSKAVENASNAIMCASTGNTSASAAAYAARAKIKCVVLIPKGAIALGKLAQALIHGAQVIAVNGNFDECLNLARAITDKYPITLVNSLNPYRIEGQKTGAFEICDSLGSAPDYHAIPVGNAGNITAYWKGYKEYKETGKIETLPKMIGFQAEGASPIVKGHIVKNPKTIATAIKIGNPASWKKAEAARDESGGLIGIVTDKEILEAYKLLASKEGVFVEPASAASVAGVLKQAKKGYFERKTPCLPAGRNDALPAGRQERRLACRQAGKTIRIVCVLTGHGLKDPNRAIASVKKPKVVAGKLQAIVREIGF